jgi:hypothetical protein
MKKQLFFFLLLVASLIVGFNSCTLKKRLYQPGYHVEWHKINNETDPHSKNKSLTLTEEHGKEKNINENQETIVNESYQTMIISDFEQVYASNDEKVSNVEIANSNKQNGTRSDLIKKVTPENNESIMNEKTINSSNLTKEERKIHWAAIVGFFLSLFVLCLFSISVFAAILFALAGLMFSGFGLEKILAYPENYRGKWLAIAGVIISGAYLFLMLLVFLYWIGSIIGFFVFFIPFFF